jgi:hypothetical protein
VAGGHSHGVGLPLDEDQTKVAVNRFTFQSDTRPALRCHRGSLNRSRGGTDYIDHQVGVGEYGNVTAGDLGHFGAHALSNEPFHVGVDGAVVLGDDVPAWLRFPRSSSDFRVEQVGIGHALGCPSKLLFMLGQIACETVDAFRTQPDTLVRDFNVVLHRCSGILAVLFPVGE